MQCCDPSMWTPWDHLFITTHTQWASVSLCNLYTICVVFFYETNNVIFMNFMNCEIPTTLMSHYDLQKQSCQVCENEIANFTPIFVKYLSWEKAACMVETIMDKTPNKEI